MNRRLVVGLVQAPANCLSVYRHQASFAGDCQLFYPCHEVLFKVLRVEHVEDASERVMAWYSVGQVQECSEPFLFALTEEFHVRPSVSTADN
jgi:hypothetical protein